MNFDGFTLGRYRFELSPVEKLILSPKNKGNVLRGAFGFYFKKIVCDDFERKCAHCELKQRCAYSYIFESFPFEGTEKLSKLSDIPRPFIINPPLEKKTEYRSGDILSFELILVGKAIRYFPFFVLTFKELGKVGIGANRGRYELRKIGAFNEVEGKEIEVYSGKDEIVRNLNVVTGFAYICQKALSLDVHTITLEFLTPTIIKYGSGVIDGKKKKGKLVRVPEFHHLIKRLRDRVNVLAHFYCGSSLDLDFKAYGEKAESVKIKKIDVRWEEKIRFSTRTKRIHELSGFVGKITYQGDLKNYLPLLVLGEYIHVGKACTFGNGWYRIVR